MDILEQKCMLLVCLSPKCNDVCHLLQLPDKSIASLVKYYYSWKKSRSRTSLMDKQAKKLSKTGDR